MSHVYEHTSSAWPEQNQGKVHPVTEEGKHEPERI
jgi:hypothetical protein